MPELTEPEQIAAAELVSVARSLFERGYSFGTAGNISVRVADRILITPTNSSFAKLTVESLACLTLAGDVVGHARPSKEVPFHLAVYTARPNAGAVVHLHSTYSTAVACLRDLDFEDALPVLTPYFAMRIPKLPVVDYFPPGDMRLGPAVRERMRESPAVLLRNHGPITAGSTLFEAAALAEELEEQAKLYLLLGERAAPLSPEQIAELRSRK